VFYGKKELLTCCHLLGYGAMMAKFITTTARTSKPTSYWHDPLDIKHSIKGENIL
jgi:hypothetical protein